MKENIGPKNALYPLPVTLVGSLVDGKPNYITIAHVGIVDLAHLSVSMAKVHYSNAGIRENGEFSVNLPPTGLVKETDYCGLVSGRKADKGSLFEAFYGVLENAPMIRECPVNMACRLEQTLDMPKHDVFIGEIVETFCDTEVLAGGNVDFSRVHPILFAMYDRSYFELGGRFADAWSCGKELMGK